jgi:hypothetical protein
MDVEQLRARPVPSHFRRREQPTVGELVYQSHCNHRWVTFAMAAGSTGLEFRRCPRCGKKAWVGPEGPVALDEVLRVLGPRPLAVPTQARA